MHRMKLIGFVIIGWWLIAADAQAQSVNFLEPLDGTTIWGTVVPVRWVADGIEVQPPDGQRVPGVGHFHLRLLRGRDAQLNLKPDEPLGKEWVHTTETSYTFENVKAGDYTLYLVVADGQHVPFDPPVMAVTHLKVIPPERTTSGAEVPSWLIVLGVGVLIVAAFFLINRGGL